MRRNVARVSLAVIVVAVGLAPSRATSPQRVAQDSLATHLETGCGGGVTGGGSGAIVTQTARFYRWSQPGPDSASRTLTFVRRDSARAAVLFREAEQRGLSRVRFSEPFNVTCFLALIRAGQRYEVAWPVGTTPPKIRSLVELSKEIDAAAHSR
jgi:hypothetical protein